MKKLFRILILVLIAGAIGGFIYWQYNKKQIVKNTIDNTISKKTDSLYYIHYDSSSIDEINGNATFYNLVLQSDSAQKKLLNSTDSLPNALYNIRIKQVTANGVDIPGLLQQRNVAAKTIILLKPVIQIINTGNEKPKPFTSGDSLELYQKILGKFTSIKADTIRITNGTLLITNKRGEAQTTFENINVTLNKFVIDSTRDYHSIISYFIKDVRATVDNIQLPASKNNTRINLENVDYNARERYLKIKSIKQYQLNNMQPIIELSNIQVNNLNTDAFVIQQRLKAGVINCDGGLVTIYVKSNKGNANKGNQSLELSTDIIDQAQVAGIKLGSTKVVIINKDESGKAPFILTNTKFTVTKILKIDGGTTINNLINNSEWELSANGFFFNTKNNLYKIGVGDFIVNNKNSVVKATSFYFKPLISEQQFVKQSRHQQDQYDFSVTNIILSGVNVNRLLSAKELEVEHASVQPVLKIYNDRTLPLGTESKLGKYPHQSLLNVELPIFIRTVKVSNGSVSYRERALKSKSIGNVFFSGINATISNITNMPARIKVNPVLKLAATARFLGTAAVATQWQFPLNANNGAFNIRGTMSGMNAMDLNPIIEPLAMASAKQGYINEVVFNIDGNDLKANGDVLVLYHDLKMDLLKKGEDKELKKKGFLSMLANTVIKNENTSRANNKTVNYDRDIKKSFFNLVWKTIFTGAKKTALGKAEKDVIK